MADDLSLLSRTELKVCSRCIYDERVSAIVFDAEGVCNYCRQIDGLVEDYGTGQPKGEARLAELLEEIRRAGGANATTA
jgi:hypothetical protein